MMTTDELMGLFRALDTTCVSDALDRLGIHGGLGDIKPVLPDSSFVGTAFTVRYVPCGPVKGTVGDYLDDVGPGQVVMIDNAGRGDCTVWGDIMSMAAQARGVAATVIDGVCRDVPAIRSLGYPVFSRGWYMVTGKDRVELAAVGAPIAISGVQVRPGDVVLGDPNGVVVVPAGAAAAVLEYAQRIDATERAIVEDVRGGLGLREARKRHGYHHLQTPAPDPAGTA